MPTYRATLIDTTNGTTTKVTIEAEDHAAALADASAIHPLLSVVSIIEVTV